MVRSLDRKIVAVAAKPGSKNIDTFSIKYSIPTKYYSWEKMIDNEKIDAIIVTSSWTSIDKIIIPLLNYKIPCFIEKPIALSSKKVKKIIDLINVQKTHIQVGYNRRFYNYNKKIKKYIKNNPIRSVVVEIPEPLDISNIELGKNLWFQNSTHVLDMMKNFFGNYFIINNNISKFINDKYYDTFNLLLSTEEAQAIVFPETSSIN